MRRAALIPVAALALTLLASPAHAETATSTELATGPDTIAAFSTAYEPLAQTFISEASGKPVQIALRNEEDTITGYIAANGASSFTLKLHDRATTSTRCRKPENGKRVCFTREGNGAWTRSKQPIEATETIPETPAAFMAYMKDGSIESLQSFGSTASLSQLSSPPTTTLIAVGFQTGDSADIDSVQSFAMTFSPGQFTWAQSESDGHVSSTITMAVVAPRTIEFPSTYAPAV